MDGVSTAASVLTLLGVTGRLVSISSSLWSAAKDIESTDKELRCIKVEVEHLVPVLRFAGSVLEQWQPNIQLSHADQQKKDQQSLQFSNECEDLHKVLINLAEEQKKTRLEKFKQWISRDRKRLAQFNTLKSRLESIKATLNLSMTAMHLQMAQHSKAEAASNQSQSANNSFQNLSEALPSFSYMLEQQEKAHNKLKRALNVSSSVVQWEASRSSISTAESNDKVNKDQNHITEDITKTVSRRSSEVFANVQSAYNDKALSPDCKLNLNYSPVRILYTSPQTEINRPEDILDLINSDQSRELAPHEFDFESEVVCSTCQGSPKTCDCHFRLWAEQRSGCTGDPQSDEIYNLVLREYLNQTPPELEFMEKFGGAGWVVIDVSCYRRVYIDLLAEGPEKSYFFKHPILELVTQTMIPGWSRVENRFGRVYYQHRDTGLIMYQHPSVSQNIDQITGRPKRYFARNTRLSLDDPQGPCQLSRRLFSTDLQTGRIRYSDERWAQVVNMSCNSIQEITFGELPRRVLSESDDTSYEGMCVRISD